MFETEDMLPRPPPMPSLQVNASEMKPAVPEVSIILTKPETNKEMKPPQSYAAWRKQNLPRVTFPPNLNDESNMPSPSMVSSGSTGTSASTAPSSLSTSSSNYINHCPNIYPLRPVSMATTPAAAGTYVNTHSIPPPSYTTDTTNQMRLESGGNPVHQLNAKSPLISSLSQFTYKSEQRRSMDSLSQRSQQSQNVLTICASTQTDTIGILEPQENNNNLKHELNQLSSLVRELREEQHQMRQILQALLCHQSSQHVPTTLKVFYCEKATQCEIENNGNGGATGVIRSASQENLPPLNMDSSTLHHGLSNVKIYSPTIKDTTRPTVPVAQSTAYRPNTPNTIKQNGPTHNQYVQNMTAQPTSSTERSMVMNELALKYLPSEKLTEIFQDTQIANAPQQRAVPLRESDNFNKAPTDISNASYKYLRKYRLLPDENCNSPTQNSSQSSPYQERVQDSPLASSNGSETANTASPHLDLEHIRRQPKFL